MVEVFYRGYGCWMLKKSYPEIDPITPEYVASGVFTLKEHDAVAYKYTQKLDKHIIELSPSTHRDSEFIRILALNPDKYKAEECYFRINVEEDKNNDRTLYVIQPDEGSDEKETKGARSRQINLICNTAKALGYNLLDIEEGGKQAIKNGCNLTKDQFKRSWTEANRRGLIRVRDKEKFLSNQ